jgi:hypothetical protein
MEQNRFARKGDGVGRSIALTKARASDQMIAKPKKGMAWAVYFGV